MTATHANQPSKPHGLAPPMVPAKVVTDRTTLPRDLESRLQQAWLQSLQPSKVKTETANATKTGTALGNEDGRSGTGTQKQFPTKEKPVSRGGSASASSSHSGNNRTSDTRSHGLKRLRSINDGNGGGSSRDLTNTLQSLWMRTQVDSAERSAYSHLPDLLSATVGSTDPLFMKEEEQRQIRRVGADRAVMGDSGNSPIPHETQHESAFENNFLRQMEVEERSSFVEEDFFRGLEGLQDAFSEMEQLLNGGNNLSEADVDKEHYVSTDESNGIGKISQSLTLRHEGLDSEGEEGDLFSEYMWENGFDQPSTGLELLDTNINEENINEESPTERSGDSYLTLEELHANESLAKITKECDRRKAIGSKVAIEKSQNGSTDVSQGKEENYQQAGGSAIELLIEVAKAIVSEDQSKVDGLLKKLDEVASVYGDAQQRLSAYFLEGFMAKMSGHKSDGKSLVSKEGCSSGCSQEGNFFAEESSIVEVNGNKSSSCKQDVKPLLEAFEVVMNASPFLTFGQVAANSAILEAFAGESHVHIVDFGTGFGFQWPALLQALAARPGGPPFVRLTAIETYMKGGKKSPYCLVHVGEKLKRTAKLWGVPFEYHPVMSPLEDVSSNNLNIKEGEAIAVNCSLRLHRLLDNCACPSSPGSKVFTAFRSLNPKVCTIVEQHTSYNSPFFLTRFYEALYYYTSLFESIDQAIPRHMAARRLFEQQIFGRAIVNVVACEGKDGFLREEPSDQWRETMRTVGFQPRRISEGLITTVKALLQTYRLAMVL